MNIIKCMLIEDEFSKVDNIKATLETYNDIKITGQTKCDKKAINVIEKIKPQVIFFNITIPNGDGIKLAKSVVQFDSNIIIVFITPSYNYATAAFEINALDYIIKPFNKKRIEITVNRIIENIENKKYNYYNFEEPLIKIIKKVNMGKNKIIDKIPCEYNGKIMLINIDEIFYCHIEKEKVYIKSNNKIYISCNSLSEIEEKTGFFKTHRSYIVNLKKVYQIYPWFNGSYKLIMDDAKKSEIPVSRGRVKELKQIFKI
ncbi:MAG: LytTR family DNA-binding domain-containing protein [Clostridium sp.]|nr:LytTR family DNA-binding domain-containing protein [Clostridium sp.]